MGKPFESEIQCLADSYNWALDADIAPIRDFVRESRDYPLIAVGSGGSYTAAHFATLLHEETGSIAKSVTPLELVSSRKRLFDSCALVLSAAGRNPDVLAAFHFAAKAEPRHLMAVCTTKGTLLASVAASYCYPQAAEYDLPSGKDGFLATNSLIATVTLLARAYLQSTVGPDEFRKDLVGAVREDDLMQRIVPEVIARPSWLFLFGRWGSSPAIDAESKFSEAALGSVQLADFRNFGHGRHHWLSRHYHDTTVVALITPDDVGLADRTLALLPSTVPVLRLTSRTPGATGTLELLVQIMHLVHQVGRARGIDPGRPGVPSFGRRIYHLALPSTYAHDQPRLGSTNVATSIARKLKYVSSLSIPAQEAQFWLAARTSFIRRLKKARFGAVVLDYDGTVCDSSDRYTGPRKEMGLEFDRLLKTGIIVGIATGRGRSVRVALRSLISEEFWHQVLIGYYNGSDIAPLADQSRPDVAQSMDKSLESAAQLLDAQARLQRMSVIEKRPKQITLVPNERGTLREVSMIVCDLLSKLGPVPPSIVTSSHSVDILAPGVSKVDLIEACQDMAGRTSSAREVLCVGDNGEWPGNDHELLATPYSLSVDTVSPDPATCWNLAPPGHRGAVATLGYLTRLHVVAGHVRFV